MFTFLHAADIHLDSPLKNLATREDAPVETIRGAARRAFDNLVQLAITEKAQFLLLAGDLYDGSWKDYNTGLFFIERMRRLGQAGIKVFLVSGNHDAASRITKTLRLPDNVVHFSAGKPETFQIDELDVAIHGQSYATRAISKNLALAYPDPIPGLFNIGLLHTGLSGRPGHEPYAPCTRDELIHKGYDYWALGHIHQREEVCSDPWIVFPGNLQGRHIRETGAKGATLVQVENGQVVNVSARDLDVARWSFCQVDCEQVDSEETLMNRVGSQFQQETEQADGRPLMLRLELRGSCPFHGELIRDSRYWQSALAGLAIDTGDIWLEKVLFHTKRLQDIYPATLEGTPLAGILNADNHEHDYFDDPVIDNLCNRLPPQLLREHPLIPDDRDARQKLLEEIRETLLAELLQQADK